MLTRIKLKVKQKLIMLHITILKIWKYLWIFLCSSWGVFSHMMCLEQFLASKNI